VEVASPDATEAGLIVTRLYATGATVEVGHHLSLVGDADLTLADGTFWHHPFGGDTAPTSAATQVAPLIAYDTFVTIGLLVDDLQTITTPGSALAATTVTGGWTSAPPGPQAAAVDISGLVGSPAAGVLIAQLSIAGECTPIVPPSYEGALRLYTAAADGGTLLGVVAPVTYVRACPDANGDGMAAVDDLLDVLAAWGRNPGHPADFNGDGIVGVDDLLALLGDWGPCVPCPG